MFTKTTRMWGTETGPTRVPRRQRCLACSSRGRGGRRQPGPGGHPTCLRRTGESGPAGQRPLVPSRRGPSGTPPCSPPPVPPASGRPSASGRLHVCDVLTGCPCSSYGGTLWKRVSVSESCGERHVTCSPPASPSVRPSVRAQLGGIARVRVVVRPSPPPSPDLSSSCPELRSVLPNVSHIPGPCPGGRHPTPSLRRR